MLKGVLTSEQFTCIVRWLVGEKGEAKLSNVSVSSISSGGGCSSSTGGVLVRHRRRQTSLLAQSIVASKSGIARATHTGVEVVKAIGLEGDVAK